MLYFRLPSDIGVYNGEPQNVHKTKKEINKIKLQKIDLKVK